MEWVHERCVLREKLREKWSEIKLLRRRALREAILHWSRHVIVDHRINMWSKRFVRIVFNCDRHIHRQYFKGIIIFCIGNNIPLCCPGEMLLFRLAYSRSETKDRDAEGLIFKILQILRSTQIPGNRSPYYDIQMKRINFIAPTEDN